MILNLLIIFNVFLFIYLLFYKKNFFSKIIILFFGLYYIFPPTMYLLFVNKYNYLNMSSELLFEKYYMDSESFIIIIILTSIFLFLAFLLPQKEKTFKIEKIFLLKLRILFISLVVLLVFLNYLYFKEAGGIVSFYTSHWAFRFQNTGIIFMLILNLKAIIPFIMLFIGLILYSKEEVGKLFKIFIFMTLVIAFVSFIAGGSGRKFAVLFIFGFFIFKISFLKKKQYIKYFIYFLFVLFLLAQILLFLRSSGFNFDSVLSIFNSPYMIVIEKVIMTSEPIGTYSNLIKIIYGIDNNLIEQGYFYEFIKIVLFPIEKLGLINIENIAFSLGKFIVPEAAYFTFFPTILIEGYYNYSVIGAVILSIAYILMARILINNIYNSLNIYTFLFKNIVFLLFVIQMIRGYFTICIGYIYITVMVLFLIYFHNMILNSLLNFKIKETKNK